jgi:predicted aspartyl protease
MSVPFNSSRGLIIVRTIMEGPSGRYTLRLALDTGATRTLISVLLLQAAGYNPAQFPTRQITSTSGGGMANVVPVTKLTALGHDMRNATVLAHNLPPSLGIDGLLGLDFLRHKILSVDFRAGQISLI